MAKHPKFEQLIAEILTEPKSASAVIDREQARAEIKSLARLDYGGALRKSLSRAEVEEIVRIARKKVWPQLNRDPVELIAPREFMQRWSGLGVDFRMADWAWPEGLALVGVYIKKTRGVTDRPVICINTAHHPAMVGAAFDHEMGHHLTSRIFDRRSEPAHFLKYTGYADHLNDPAELAADLLVTLGAYPQIAARELFEAGDPRRMKSAPFDVRSFEKAMKYVAERYGLKFNARFSNDKKLQCLAALIHYTRLRQALLDEYGI
ncbi:MAG: hypothetical protein IVW54_02845 [Candidatus Binataceae bacterium]|nr:hypothetical protein [Candidatus Binataceae bacterium]